VCVLYVVVVVVVVVVTRESAHVRIQTLPQALPPLFGIVARPVIVLVRISYSNKLSSYLSFFVFLFLFCFVFVLESIKPLI